jgi:hypothetical protein
MKTCLKFQHILLIPEEVARGLFRKWIAQARREVPKGQLLPDDDDIGVSSITASRQRREQQEANLEVLVPVTPLRLQPTHHHGYHEFPRPIDSFPSKKLSSDYDKEEDEFSKDAGNVSWIKLDVPSMDLVASLQNTQVDNYMLALFILK